jgi:hypothetical protein
MAHIPLPAATIGGVSVFHGDCLDVLRGMPEASVDAVVTDPPAGIAFMGREWDKDKGGRDHWIAWMREVAAECLRVAKPGAHALVWSLPRTSHWTATAWEDAGWTVRDRLAHIFGVGFPKGKNVSVAIDEMLGAEREIVGPHPYAARKPNGTWTGECCGAEPGHASGPKLTAPATPEAAKWQGWHTQLKPAVEDWWLLRKPLAEPTVAANVVRHGTGAINVDACRVGMSQADADFIERTARPNTRGGVHIGDVMNRPAAPTVNVHSSGRWPANLCHDGSPEVLDAFGRFGDKGGGGQSRVEGRTYARGDGWRATYDGPQYKDTGTAARFFPALGFGEDELRFMYSAKASRADRCGSKHPTVKPVALMRWLCRLITPPSVSELVCVYCANEHGKELPGMRPSIPTEEHGADRLLDPMQEQDIGSRRAKTVPSDLPDLWDGVSAEGHRVEVLLDLVQSAEPETFRDSVPPMSADVSSAADQAGKSQQILFQGVFRSDGEAEADAVQGLRSPVPADEERPPQVLLDEMRGDPFWSGSTPDGRPSQPTRIHSGEAPTSPDGIPRWVRDAASPSDGRTSGAQSSPVRGRASQKRGEKRQPNREPGTHAQAPARQDTETSAQADRLSPLRGNDQGFGSCPSCGSRLTKIERPGVILDPFAGSGTTGQAALAEGFSAILIEREPEYVEDILARLRRLKDGAPLLADLAEPAT